MHSRLHTNTQPEFVRNSIFTGRFILVLQVPSEHHRLSNASSLYDPISVDYSPSQANTAMGPDLDVSLIPNHATQKKKKKK